jgi:2-succinyl-6-hydroxy-2,4-cyclohexadiene-1-carboxylate synthase
VLHVEVDGGGPRLVLVHGFTQTGRSWGPVAADLAGDHEVVRVDAPGHGESAALATDMVDGARLLGEVGGTATYIGYSMGARLCLHLALARPDRVGALVLISGTAGIEDPVARRTRQLDDEWLASKVETVGVAEFVRNWLTQPLFAGLNEDSAGLQARLENTEAGLATSLRLAGTGAQEPLWARLAELDMPVMAVTGAHDEAFTLRAEEMVDLIGTNATVAVVPGAGHAVHLEAPDSFLAAVRPFLKRTDAGAADAL